MYKSHGPSPVFYIKADGTQVAYFPEPLAKWVGVNDQGQTAMLDSSNCLDETCPAEAKAAQQAYWDGIVVGAAVRRQKPINHKAKKKQQVMDLRSGARRRFDLE